MDGFRIPSAVSSLINALTLLPGIGVKTAQRLAFFIINMPEDEVLNLGKAIVFAKRNLVICTICGMIDDSSPCVICQDKNREQSMICIVQEVRDVWAMERTKSYHGLYHVLRGAISPMMGIGPDALNISSLQERLQGPENENTPVVPTAKVKEIILATNFNVDGEATAMYLSKILKSFGVKITRIAHGLPVGSDLEYADEFTLAKAFSGRQEM